jgi:hypothetical protein
MELSAAQEVAGCAVTQELSSILWNLKVPYCIHKSSPLIPVLGQTDPVKNPHFISPVL